MIDDHAAAGGRLANPYRHLIALQLDKDAPKHCAQYSTRIVDELHTVHSRLGTDDEFAPTTPASAPPTAAEPASSASSLWILIRPR
jgi:hypothetical protein